MILLFLVKRGKKSLLRFSKFSGIHVTIQNAIYEELVTTREMLMV